MVCQVLPPKQTKAKNGTRLVRAISRGIAFLFDRLDTPSRLGVGASFAFCFLLQRQFDASKFPSSNQRRGYAFLRSSLRVANVLLKLPIPMIKCTFSRLQSPELSPKLTCLYQCTLSLPFQGGTANS